MRMVSTGQDVVRTTRSATLPMTRWLSPVRPRVADDQVHVFGFSNLDDLSVWCPCHHAASDLYRDALGRWEDGLKLKAPLALQVFNRWHVHALRDIAFNRECRQLHHMQEPELRAKFPRELIRVFKRVC
jgi:hypothetical protein